MGVVMLGVLLIVVIVAGVSAAARGGHVMPMAVCLASIVIGSLLVATPALASFLLKLLAREGRLGENECVPCWILGGILALVGLVAAFFTRPAPAVATARDARTK